MEAFDNYLYRPDPPEDAVVPAWEFGPDYVLPGHGRRLELERRHAVPRDDRIRFIEAPHLYLVRGPDGREHQVFSSVTTVAGSTSAPFDGPEVIEKMRTGGSQAWPRSGLCVDERTVPAVAMADGSGRLQPSRGILMLSRARDGSATTLAALDPRTVARLGLAGGTLAALTTALATARGGRRATGPVEYATFARALTEPEILQKWADDAAEASRRGTEGHFQAEQFLNGLRMHETPELAVCRQFIARFAVPAGARPYRTEWEIFTALPTEGGEGIAGSVDVVLRYPDGALAIVDWKRSPKLLSKLWGFGGRPAGMLPPLDHLDDCSGAVYALQLNIYAYILETYYGERVRSMTLCSIHPDKPYSTDVPRLALETAYLMAVERLRAATHEAARRAADPGDETPLLCQLTGALRTHAMMHPGTRLQVQHGALYSEGVDPAGYVVDEPARRRVLDAVLRADAPMERAAVDAAAEALAAGRIHWREMMPKPGLTDCLGSDIAPASKRVRIE
jgi:hypothetical protein